MTRRFGIVGIALTRSILIIIVNTMQICKVAKLIVVVEVNAIAIRVLTKYHYL